jgi:hypothetical protein
MFVQHKTGLFMRISERWWTSMNPSALPYKEEAAGSNPASPTWKKRHLQVKRRTSEWGGIRFLTPLLQPYCNPKRLSLGDGTQRRFHRVDCGVLHTPRSTGRATHKRATFPAGVAAAACVLALYGPS